MQFTIFSLAVAILWVSIFAKIASLLRKNMAFLEYFSIYPLLIILMFCIVRLFVFVEFPFTIIINSQHILPFIQSFLCSPFTKLGNISINLALIIAVIWGLVTISIILKHIADYYRFRHLLDFLPESDDMQVHNIFSMVNAHGRLSNAKIIVHDCIESPAIVGIINPVLLLPKISFSDDELLGIIIHESAHFLYGHCIIKCITEFIRACFWWNPLFKELSLEVAHALEMQSDKVVCKKISKKQQKNYLLGIAKVAEGIDYSRPIPAFSCSLVEEKDGEKLKQRFKMILGGYYHVKKKRYFLTLPAIIVIFLLSYSVVFQPYSLPDANDIGVSDSVNEDCYLVETEDGYDLYDSTNTYIAKITYIDESLKNLKIYKNLEDVK